MVVCVIEQLADELEASRSGCELSGTEYMRSVYMSNLMGPVCTRNETKGCGVWLQMSFRLTSNRNGVTSEAYENVAAGSE